MKKILLAVLASALLFSTQLKAQPFVTDDNVLSVGIGPAPVYYGLAGYTSKLPALVVHFEKGFFDKLGIGYLGIGGYLGFTSAKYESTYFGGGVYSYSESNTIIAARGAYHFDFLDLSGEDIFEKLDVYAGILTGFRIHREDWNNDIFEDEDNFVGGVFDTFAGARYYFTPEIAVYTELGYGISYLTLGASFKF